MDWNPLLPSVAQPFHPTRERDCTDGSPACIEETLSEMYRRFDRRYANCDHNAAFGITYIRVTEAVRARLLAADLYEEPRFIHHEDKVFARMYFEAFDAWERGDRAKVPPAWREALDAGRERRVSGLGNLLMSMNAHINRDFPFMLDALGLTQPNGSSRKPDHDRGNRVLHPLYDDVLRELAARFDPTTDDYDLPGLFADDVALFQILQGWREQVWRHTEMLGAARSAEERRAVAQYIEDYSLATARTIESQTRISSSAVRDAHCTAFRRTRRETGGQGRPRVRGSGLRASRRGFVSVRVACPEPVRDCSGAVRAMRRRRPMSTTARYAMRAGETRLVRVRLRLAARRVLARRGRLAVRVVSASRSPWGTSRVAAARARLLPPR